MRTRALRTGAPLSVTRTRTSVRSRARMRSDRGTAMHAASPRAAREPGDARRLPSTPEAGFDGVDGVDGGVVVAGGVMAGVEKTDAVASAGGIVTGRWSTLLVNTAVA